MAFSGLSTNKLFTPSLVGEDISDIILRLSPYEAPILDWLGDAPTFATSTKHEYIEDFLRPRTITITGAINSATAATAAQVTGAVGEALTVGTILELTNATPERMQVTSILSGGGSIVFSRNYDGAGIGSSAAGAVLQVRAPSAPEGDEHQGLHTARLGNRRANTVGYFKIEIAQTGTADGINQLGNDSYELQRAKLFAEVPAILEAEILTGVLNGTNSLGTTTATRTMSGLRQQITSAAAPINSQVNNVSFSANPHTYIGDAMQNIFNAGGSTSEDWGVVAGSQYFRDISQLNDSKVQDSNAREVFKRVIRQYEGPFGQMTVFLSRALAQRELMIIPRNRVRVLPLNQRNFMFREMGLSGDNRKGMVVGEYVGEFFHVNAMARIRTESPA